mgnify:CR=1 FL=1
MDYKVSREFKFGSRLVGSEYPCFVIAEISANHGGSLGKALDLVQAAAEAGADAIKLQTYTADTITLNADTDDFQICSGPWLGRSLWDLYKEAHTPWEWHEAIFQKATKLGLQYFSSPFDETAVDFLQSLDVAAFKVASPEINHIPLLEKIARTGKPVILSAGLATKCDIHLAIDSLKSNGCGEIAVLQCTTAYPAPVEDSNLNLMARIAHDFDVVTGLSDHSNNPLVGLAAVSAGAKMIEKHITLTEDHTVDSFFSTNPTDFKTFVRDLRLIETALGKGEYGPAPSALGSMQGRRSIYASEDIKKGTEFSVENVICIRPSYGLDPIHWKHILGAKANRDIKKGQRLLLDDLN